MQGFHGLDKGNILHSIASLDGYLTHADAMYRPGQFLLKMIVKCRLY